MKRNSANKKSNIMLVTKVALGLAVVLSSALSFAKDFNRFVITYKNDKTFSSAKNLIYTAANPSRQLFSNTNTQVTDILENLNSVIVVTTSESLNVNSTEVVIQPEVFHPAPAPVQGFDSSYGMINQITQGLPTPTTVALQRPWGIDAVKAPKAWALGYSGQGVRVAVLDTGIDKDHPALKVNFEKGRNFTTDDSGVADPALFIDEEGHGTHVAGTIAATELEGGFVGVAPKAKLLSGKVCSKEGCSNISIAQAINWAITEKVDVISMSLGGARITPLEQAALTKAEKAGVTVVAASGNDGTAVVSFPAAIETVIAVGATDSKNQKAKFSQWGPELDIAAPGVDVVSSVPQGTGRASIVDVDLGTGFQRINSTSFVGSKAVENAVVGKLKFVGLGKPEDFSGVDLNGFYALIKRGEITFVDKVKNAIGAGAEGVVIFNNTDGLVQGSVSEDGSELTIPVVMIEQKVGDSAVAALQAGKSVQLKVKTEKTDYAGFQGTSMATPHVSGVVALMKSAKKSLTPVQVRSIIKLTATVLTPNDQNQFGAGLINAEKAVTQSLQ